MYVYILYLFYYFIITLFNNNKIVKAILPHNLLFNHFSNIYKVELSKLKEIRMLNMPIFYHF